MMNWNKIQSIEDLLILRARQLKKRNENFEKTTLHLRRMKEQNKEFFDDKHQLRWVFLSVNDLMLRHDIKLNNKHDFKLIFRWNELFRILKVDSIKKTYVLKELNEARFNETYAENWLKHFRTRNVRAENAEEKKLDLTLIQKDAEKFKKKTETAEEDFKEKFEMLKKKSD